MTSPTLNKIERACADLTRNGRPITISAVAEHTGISRSTIYRNPELRTVIEHHREDAADGEDDDEIPNERAVAQREFGEIPHCVRTFSPSCSW